MRRWRGNPWAVLITLCLGFFMTLLDVTIVNIAIPSMIDSLDASFDEILWVINSYVIVLAVLVITAGRLGDARGQRSMFMLGVAVFTAASLACGLAQGPAMLIAFRAVQGLGAAILMPQTSALLITTFPPEKRGAAFGVWGGVAGVATIAGPTLGGLLVTAFDWRWIFFINIPIGILTLFMAAAIIPEQVRRRRHPLDVDGVVLATVALVALTFGLVEGERFEWGRVWSFVTIPGLIGVGALLLVAFFVLQARKQDREPLVPFVLFRDRNYAVMNAVSALVGVAMVGLFLPLTIYLQSVLGYSALKTGLVMAPMSVVSMVVAPFAGRLADRVGGKVILITGLLAFAAGMGSLVLTADTESQWWYFLPSLVVAGFGVGCVFAPMNTIAMRNVAPAVAGAASGVLNTVRQLGTVVGSAVVGAVLQAQLTGRLHDEAVARAGALPEEVRQPFVDGFADAAEGGLQLGSGQAGGMTPPADLPADLAQQVGELGQVVFRHGYVNAMHPTLLVPISGMVVAAGLCVFVRRSVRARRQAEAQVAAVPSDPAA